MPFRKIASLLMHFVYRTGMSNLRHKTWQTSNLSRDTVVDHKIRPGNPWDFTAGYLQFQSGFSLPMWLRVSRNNWLNHARKTLQCHLGMRVSPLISFPKKLLFYVRYTNWPLSPCPSPFRNHSQSSWKCRESICAMCAKWPWMRFSLP